MGRTVDYLGGPNVITRMHRRQEDETQRSQPWFSQKGVRVMTHHSVPRHHFNYLANNSPVKYVHAILSPPFCRWATEGTAR